MTVHCHRGGGGPCSLAGHLRVLSGPARASICIWCISLNQTPGDAVACRISVLGLVFYSLRPGPVLIPHRWVSPLASSCPPRSQPALGGSGCDCDGSHTVKSLSRPSHPIPSSPSPWWSWWFAAFLTPSALCCRLLLPSSWSPSPSPSISPLWPVLPNSWASPFPLSLSRSCSDPPTPHPHGVLGLTPHLFPPRAHLPLLQSL